MPAKPASPQASTDAADAHNGAVAGPAQPRSHDFAETAPPRDQDPTSPSSPPPAAAQPQRPGHKRNPTSNASAESIGSFAGDAAETYQEARQAFERGTASPYFMAVVAFLCSLSQGLPLASMFKVYTFLICEVYDSKRLGQVGGTQTGNLTEVAPARLDTWMTAMLSFSSRVLSPSQPELDLSAAGIPAAPELPHPPQCNAPEVQKTTSAYAATMATVGALLALTLLDRVTRVSKHFGRKPIMLLPQLLIALALAGFRLSVAVPQYAGAALLFCAVVILEASAGAPLRISIQNYIVDTTTDSQRAAALSFVDGFGQVGAFPSSTLGGFLAAITGKFFAPFYASIAVALISFAYILVLVPESKRHRHHTLIDEWEHSAEAEERHAAAERRRLHHQQNQAQFSSRRQSYQSDAASSYVSTESNESVPAGRWGWKRHLRGINFLEPLSIFLPTKYGPAGGRRQGRYDFRLLNLAAIIIAEETFQVFLVPTMLLFNSDVFGLDVLQNGYLVSLLQGVRALFLTAIFPRAVAFARRWISSHVQRRKDTRKRKANGADSEAEAESDTQAQQRPNRTDNESTPLLNGSRTRPSSARSRSRSSSHFGARAQYEEESEEGDSHWGASSEYTSTTVAKQEERGKLDVWLMVSSYALACGSFLLLALSRRFSYVAGGPPPWLFLALGIVGIQLSSGATSVRTALVVNAVPENAQSRALAANQVLCTSVYASVPLLTSLVYGSGLQYGIPELVWIFKASFAAVACVGSLALFVTHRGPSARL